MKATSKSGKGSTTELAIKGTRIHASLPEGKTVSMTLQSLGSSLLEQQSLAEDFIFPDGTKHVRRNGPCMVVVHETAPATWCFKWIAADSPAAVGPEAKYRRVRIALPYVVVLGTFAERFCGGRRKWLSLSSFNAAFFRNAPLGSIDDELCFPALLNCAQFQVSEVRPMPWICTQFLDRPFDREPDENRRLRLGMKALLACLFETGFNHHCELNGVTSWFTKSASADPRIASIEAWEEATRENDCFALDVPWLKSGMTLRMACQAVFQVHHARRSFPRTAAALARHIVNHADEAAAAEAAPPDDTLDLPF